MMSTNLAKLTFLVLLQTWLTACSTIGTSERVLESRFDNFSVHLPVSNDWAIEDCVSSVSKHTEHSTVFALRKRPRSQMAEVRWKLIHHKRPETANKWLEFAVAGLTSRDRGDIISGVKSIDLGGILFHSALVHTKPMQDGPSYYLMDFCVKAETQILVFQLWSRDLASIEAELTAVEQSLSQLMIKEREDIQGKLKSMNDNEK